MADLKIGRPGMLDALACVTRKASELQEWSISPHRAGSSEEEVDAAFTEGFEFLEGYTGDVKRMYEVWKAERAKEAA